MNKSAQRRDKVRDGDRVACGSRQPPTVPRQDELCAPAAGQLVSTVSGGRLPEWEKTMGCQAASAPSVFLTVVSLGSMDVSVCV